jgi:hypothetical protein
VECLAVSVYRWFPISRLVGLVLQLSGLFSSRVKLSHNLLSPIKKYLHFADPVTNLFPQSHKPLPRLPHHSPAPQNRQREFSRPRLLFRPRTPKSSLRWRSSDPPLRRRSPPRILLVRLRALQGQRYIEKYVHHS